MSPISVGCSHPHTHDTQGIESHKGTEPGHTISVDGFSVVIRTSRYHSGLSLVQQRSMLVATSSLKCFLLYFLTVQLSLVTLD